MRILYEKIEDRETGGTVSGAEASAGKDGMAVRICRCFGWDGEVEIPEEIEGLPVREIGAYAFAPVLRRETPGEKFTAWIGELPETESEKDAQEKGAAGGEAMIPAICGDALKSVDLPSSLRKIGAYAFYGCGNLEKVRAFSTATDLGAGLFTGCYGIQRLDIRIIPGRKSCLKETLAELRQTLTLDYRAEKGDLLARLIFPEFFEESVENTPARILMREMHGCGHMYRNAFVGTDFQFLVYDRLFPHVQVEEKPLLVAKLALNRLRYPCQLSPGARETYEKYLAEHGKEIVQAAEEEQDTELLSFAASAAWCSESAMEDMLSEAAGRGLAQFTGILMDARYARKTAERGSFQEKKEDGAGAGKRRRRFEL